MERNTKHFNMVNNVSSSKKYLFSVFLCLFAQGLCSSSSAGHRSEPAAVISVETSVVDPGVTAASAPVDPAEAETLTAIAGKWMLEDTDALHDDFKWIEVHITLRKDKTFTGVTSIEGVAVNGSAFFHFEELKFSGTYSLMPMNVFTWVLPDEDKIRFNYTVKKNENAQTYKKLIEYTKEAIVGTLTYEYDNPKLGDFVRER